ncbi:hypothetical protein DRQ09_04680 [candidate division KSB1 bacterium]|nr:MAG: hypothetical protein DRQ09_04680 [candidate division KSB1 bacterium]
MNLTFYYILDVLIFTRLIFQFKDKPITKSNFLIKTVVEIFGLILFSWNYWLMLVVVILFTLNYLSYIIELNTKRLNLLRIIFLLLYITIFSFIFSPSSGIHFNTAVRNISKFQSSSIILELLVGVNWATATVILMGLLLNLNEVNFLIRYLLEKLDFAPKLLSENNQNKHNNKIIDKSEYNAGRIIGILERIIIYFFVLNGSYTAIGIVLAAKGFTRFKELEKRAFAEYVLIGTLLSTILASTIALLVKKILLH